MSLLNNLFNKRIRGFRLIELVTLGCLTVVVLGLYFSKAGAGRESAKISDVNKQIAEEQRHARLLKAELTHLEAPERLEQLSTQYLGLAPASGKREITPEGLSEVARQSVAPKTSETHQ
jgi:hypothetical protein